MLLNKYKLHATNKADILQTFEINKIVRFSCNWNKQNVYHSITIQNTFSILFQVSLADRNAAVSLKGLPQRGWRWPDGKSLSIL